MSRLPMVRSNFFCLSRALLAVVFLAAGSHATASIVAQPSGLNPGDQYRLVLVTSGGTNAVPDGVAYYNDFVTNAANSVPELAALSTEWRAIVSSTTFGANENTGTNSGYGVPIYRLDGLRIADDNLDLWDRSIINPINRTELGTIRSSQVWTGSEGDGGPNVTYFGNLIAADFSINANGSFVGNSSSTDRSWVRTSTELTHTTVLPLYGMSGILTAQAPPSIPDVPPSVPEPSSLVCFGGLMALAGWRRSGRRFCRGAGCRTAAPQ